MAAALRSAVETPRRPDRTAPVLFAQWTAAAHRALPRPLRRRVPDTFIGYALINGTGFLIDIGFLWLFYERLHWLYPLAVTLGYAIAGAYSLLLNRWLNFRSRGSISAQGGRYAVGLFSQYVIFILGLSSLLHWLGVNAELARVLSACCEGVYLYTLMRVWVFREEGAGAQEGGAPVTRRRGPSPSARRAR